LFSLKNPKKFQANNTRAKKFKNFERHKVKLFIANKKAIQIVENFKLIKKAYADKQNSLDYGINAYTS
jgi:hypothetical protein